MEFNEIPGRETAGIIRNTFAPLRIPWCDLVLVPVARCIAASVEGLTPLELFGEETCSVLLSGADPPEQGERALLNQGKCQQSVLIHA